MEQLSYEEFIARYPQFAFLPASTVSIFLEDADLLWDPVVLKKFWKRICYLFVAHLLSLQYEIDNDEQVNNPAVNNMNLNANTGVPTWQQSSPGHLAERRSVTELANSKNAYEAFMAQTQFGLELMALLNLLVPGMRVVVAKEPRRFSPYFFNTPFNLGV